jgi:hypothetical protein
MARCEAPMRRSYFRLRMDCVAKLEEEQPMKKIGQQSNRGERFFESTLRGDDCS